MPERAVLALLFGGRSVEHDVSIRSARSVMRAIDRERYDVVPVAVDPDGRWFTGPNPLAVFDPREPQGGRVPVRLLPEPDRPLLIGEGAGERRLRPDCYFPLIHGHGGEDGTLQGLFELAEVPYAGAGVLASALAMDKARSKVVLRAAGLPVLEWTTVRRHEWRSDRDAVVARLRGWRDGVLFVKPSNGGSSVGVTRVDGAAGLPDALDDALTLDVTAIIEPAVDAREIEVSVLGNDEPRASVPGEIVPSREFYDYQAKYADDSTRLLVPAPVDDEAAERLRELALETFRALGCAGLARIDFLVERADGTPWISEANTLPGFTDVSMYPRLWEASGIGYADLIEQIVTLARERHGVRRGLRRRLGGKTASERVV